MTSLPYVLYFRVLFIKSYTISNYKVSSFYSFTFRLLIYPEVAFVCYLGVAIQLYFSPDSNASQSFSCHSTERIS